MEDALKHLQEAMRMDPDNSEVRLFLKKLKNMENKKEEGNQAFLAGDLSRACESSSWLLLCPADWPLECLAFLGRYQDAIDVWSAGLQLDPANRSFNSKLYYNRASAFLKLKKNEEAVRDCDRAISMDEEYFKAYQRRAEANLAIGGPERIKRAIR